MEPEQAWFPRWECHETEGPGTDEPESTLLRPVVPGPVCTGKMYSRARQSLLQLNRALGTQKDGGASGLEEI